MVNLIVFMYPTCFYQPFGCRCLLMHRFSPKNTETYHRIKISVLTIIWNLYFIYGKEIKKRLKNFA
ncbi:hypothetical protein AK44_07555, partial [Salmonella enterica subsp. enterica serovar Bareilly str. CFSAN000967]